MHACVAARLLVTSQCAAPWPISVCLKVIVAPRVGTRSRAPLAIVFVSNHLQASQSKATGEGSCDVSIIEIKHNISILTTTN